MRFTFNLVPNWQTAYKWLSVQAAALLGVLLSIQAALPTLDGHPELESITQSGWYHSATAVLAFLIIVLRLIHQPLQTPPPAKE